MCVLQLKKNEEGPECQCVMGTSGHLEHMKYITRQCCTRTWHLTCYWRLEHKSQLIKAENTGWADGIEQHSTALQTSPNTSFFCFCPWRPKNNLCASLIAKTEQEHKVGIIFVERSKEPLCVFKKKKNESLDCAFPLIQVIKNNLCVCVYSMHVCLSVAAPNSRLQSPHVGRRQQIFAAIGERLGRFFLSCLYHVTCCWIKDLICDCQEADRQVEVKYDK